MKLKEAIILTAEYYGKSISPTVLQMYERDLSDLPENECIAAYSAYRRNPKNRAFPLPAQIRDMVRPSISDEDDAREAASRIVGAVTKFGWCNSRSAHTYMGDLAWAVVERLGGWAAVCQLNVHDIGIFQAQARDLAKSIAARSRAGLHDQAPALPTGDVKTLITETIKKLEMKNEDPSGDSNSQGA